jgi:hypothetical protein
VVRKTLVTVALIICHFLIDRSFVIWTARNRCYSSDEAASSLLLRAGRKRRFGSFGSLQCIYTHFVIAHGSPTTNTRQPRIHVAGDNLTRVVRICSFSFGFAVAVCAAQ